MSTSTLSARLIAADQKAARLAHVTDPATLAAVLTGTERAVARRLAGHVAEDTARADALARALEAVARDGRPVGEAVAQAARDACADAVRDSAEVACLSLDMTTADGTTTLAELLDSGAGEAATARLSHHDDGNGGYRGVARVPVPLDLFRPTIPAPEEIAEAVRDCLTEEARRLLRVTVAVNVAAEAQSRAHAEEIAAVAEMIERDKNAARLASRSALAAQCVKPLKNARDAARQARADIRADHNPHRPRTAEVAAVLGTSTTGRAAVALGRQQAAAWAAYQAQRAAIVRACLEAHTERLDESADRQRAAFRAAPGAAIVAARCLAPAKRIGAMSASRLAHLIAASRRQHPTPPREWRTVRALGTEKAARTVAPVLGHTDADPAEGATPRPVRALQGWHAGHALPGSAKRASADVDAVLTARQSRTHADAEAPAAPLQAAQMAPSPAPRAYVPGACAAMPRRAAVAPPALTVSTRRDREPLPATRVQRLRRQRKAARGAARLAAWQARTA